MTGGQGGEAARGLSDLGVYATHTSAIIDAEGVLKHVRVGPHVLRASEVAEYCPVSEIEGTNE